MSRKRLLSILAAVSVTITGFGAALLPVTASNAAEACVAAYSSSAVYPATMRASYNSHNWTAKWWTQGEAPSTGGSGVWQDNGACGGTPPPPSGSCNYPNWAAGTFYPAGSI